MLGTVYNEFYVRLQLFYEHAKGLFFRDLYQGTEQPWVGTHVTGPW
jgi:hypothetical protein